MSDMSDSSEAESPAPTTPSAAAVTTDDVNDIGVDKLIGAVAKRPQLWNKHSPLYMDRNLKIKTWEEVCKEIVENWSQLSNKQKKTTGLKIQKKWRNLKDTFNKEIAIQKKVSSGEGSRKKKKYIYFDALSFLASSNTLRETSGNITLEEDSTQSEADAGADIALSNRRLAATLRKKTNIRENTEAEEELLNILKNQNRSFDEDVSFAEMIIPMLKKLNIEQKHFAKVEILNTLHRARYFVPPPVQSVPQYTYPQPHFSQSQHRPPQPQTQVSQPQPQIIIQTPCESSSSTTTFTAPPSTIILSKTKGPQPSTSSCANYVEKFTMDLMTDCNTSGSEDLYDLGGLYDSFE